MPLSWNEIKERAVAFSKEWETAKSEDGDAKSFWDGFFNVFGVNRRRVATFEYKVVKGNRNDGYIDLLWKGVLLVEHKSAGKNLDKAHEQAIDYFPGLKDHDLPKYICVCNFHNFRLQDLDEGIEIRFELKDLISNVQHFGFLAGYQKRTFKEQAPINIEAAYRMGKLHDELKKVGYEGHQLEVYLVRILYCLFAEDTGIFEKDSFKYFIETKTKEDGSDLGAMLAQFFQVLNTPRDKRLSNLDEDLTLFPYVNGMLYEEQLSIASYNTRMREILLDCMALDWSKISPAIFGSMFQSVLNPIERRNLGAHYTSEKNIMKVIKPLFLDELYEEFNRVKYNISQLRAFHKKLSTLKFLDPACGCGNFLVISYRELRLLELEILKIIYKHGQLSTNIDDIVWINLTQFYGIEIEEWPCKIAEVAMWLMEHQMNLRLSEEFGQYFIRLPLGKTANIANENALRIDWNSLLDPIRTIEIYASKANIIKIEEPKYEYGEVNIYTKSFEIVDKAPVPAVSEQYFNYIFGNPPFIGSKMMTDEQRKDILSVFSNADGASLLDFVCGWYILAAKYMNNKTLSHDKTVKCAFVSTNSISQGEQVVLMWNLLLKEVPLFIHFAHRTFKWSNEGRNNAAVFCVIVGFSNEDSNKKIIFEYENVNSEPYEIVANNINPYLVDSRTLLIKKSTSPICSVPQLVRGSIPYDDGNLLMLKEEYEELILKEPTLKKYFKKYGASFELINNKWRYCLWLVNISPDEMLGNLFLRKQIEKVYNFRIKSKGSSVKSKAKIPSLFGDIRQPTGFNYLMIPRVSSERRKYIPIGFIDQDVILGDSAYGLPDASFIHFGVLTSEMHMTWVRYTCGRLKSDFRYSKDIVYNNFPWPENPSEQHKEAIEKAAQKVLDVRAEFPDSSLANLYNPLMMPPALVKAHQDIDKAVDLAYRKEPFTSEAKRIEFLFELYEKYTAGMFKEEKKKRRGKR